MNCLNASMSRAIVVVTAIVLVDCAVCLPESVVVYNGL